MVALLMLSQAVSSQIINIPDLTFKWALIMDTDVNTNLDLEIDSLEADSYTGVIDLYGDGINDMTGIEYFVNMTELYLTNNNLTSLDVTKCVGLERLHIQNNNISVLDVTNNVELYDLRMDNNSISVLDVTNNTKLEDLLIYNNNISEIDASGCYKLDNMSCGQNNMSYLNLKNGNNINASFGGLGNPDLCVTVDDTAWANANWISQLEATAKFSDDCSAQEPTGPTGIYDISYRDTDGVIYNLMGSVVYRGRINREHTGYGVPSGAYILSYNGTRGVVFIDN